MVAINVRARTFFIGGPSTDVLGGAIVVQVTSKVKICSTPVMIKLNDDGRLEDM
jgi:hypothetical protein